MNGTIKAVCLCRIWDLQQVISLNTDQKFKSGPTKDDDVKGLGVWLARLGVDVFTATRLSSLF